MTHLQWFNSPVAFTCPVCQSALPPQPDELECSACGTQLDHDSFAVEMRIPPDSQQHWHTFFAVILPLGLAMLMFAANGWRNGWLWAGVFGVMSFIAPLAVTIMHAMRDPHTAGAKMTLLFTSTGVMRRKNNEWLEEIPYGSLGRARVVPGWRGGYRMIITTRALAWFGATWIDGRVNLTPDEAISIQEEIQSRIRAAQQLDFAV